MLLKTYYKLFMSNAQFVLQSYTVVPYAYICKDGV